MWPFQWNFVSSIIHMVLICITLFSKGKLGVYLWNSLSQKPEILSVNRFTPRVQWMMSLAKWVWFLWWISLWSFKWNLFGSTWGNYLFFSFTQNEIWKVCYNFGSEGLIKAGYFSEVFSPLSESYKPEPCTLTTLAARKTAFLCKNTQRRTYSHDGPF